eukprot:gb/GEZN01001644.1/.p1 GENE.gb/GEZN01001644.1/~~gb/GEZN01001644.1/.p1  ORF type:complete len:928 (+),score=180.24 gb/GEZN01001644.1/:398-2785(+)
MGGEDNLEHFKKNGAHTNNQPIFGNSTKEGWLIKQGAVRKNWKTRYFVLIGSQLIYFESWEKASERDPSKSKGIVELKNATLAPIAPSAAGGRRFAFGLATTAGACRTYVLVAQSEADFQEWVRLLVSSSSSSSVQSTTKGLSSPVGGDGGGDTGFQGKFNGSRFEGYLTKLGAVRKNWKLRYFVLVGNNLFYFENEAVASKCNPGLAKGKIEMRHARLKPVSPSEASGRNHVFGIITGDATGRTYTLAAESGGDFEKWVHILFLDPQGHTVTNRRRTEDQKSKEEKVRETEFFSEYTKQIKEEEMARLEAELEYQQMLKQQGPASRQTIAGDADWGFSLLRLREVNHKRQLYATVELLDQEEEWFVKKSPPKPKPQPLEGDELRWQGEFLTSRYCGKEYEFPTGDPFLFPKKDWTSEKIVRICLWGTQLLQASTFLGFATTGIPQGDNVQKTLALHGWTGESLPGSLQIQIVDLEISQQLEKEAMEDHKQRAKEKDVQRQRKIAEMNAKLDAYEIGKELGRGTYGKVVEVRHKESKEKYAMKRMAKKRIKASERESILEEMRVLQVFEHPNINSLFEWFETGSEIVAVLTLCSGGEVIDRVKRESLCWSEAHAARVIKDLVAALSYLHSRGYVHRDIKPQNLVCLNEGTGSPCILIDFGLTEQVGTGLSLRCGTPPYSAPELVNNAPNKDNPLYGQEVDVWAVGVMIYLLLTGKFPFWDDDDEKRRQLITSAKADLTNPRLSPAAKHLLQKIFVANPDQRANIQYIADHNWFDQAPSSPLPKQVISNLIELMDQ